MYKLGNRLVVPGFSLPLQSENEGSSEERRGGRSKPTKQVAILTHFVPFLFLFFDMYVCDPYSECTRGGFCNFMHLKPISRDLK